MARSAVSSSRVGYHDPKRVAKNLASIELPSAAGQNVLCSVLEVNECAKNI